MFGPPDDRVAATRAQSMAWKIKRFSNDELRQRFVDMTRAAGRVPRPHAARPGPALERGARPLRLRRDRLGRVLRGAQGQRPVQPRAHARRRAAHEDGAWVREAAAAHAREAAHAAARASVETSEPDDSEMAAAGRSSSAPRRGLAHTARRQPARARRRDGAAQRARRLHAPQRGRVDLGRAADDDHRDRRPDEKDALFEPAADKIYRHPDLLRRCPTK